MPRHGVFGFPTPKDAYSSSVESRRFNISQLTSLALSMNVGLCDICTIQLLFRREHNIPGKRSHPSRQEQPAAASPIGS